MLNYLLVWIVFFGSVGLYLSRFFLPEVQRKNDWIWSVVGLFYALILLADSDRIRGGLLLGQMASVSLIVRFGWQTLQQRRQLAPFQDQTTLPGSVDGILPFVKTGWGRLLAAYKEGTLLDAVDPSDATDSSKQLFKIGGFTIPTDLTKIFSMGSSTEAKETVPASAQSDTQASSPEIDEDWEEETVAVADPLPVPEAAPETITEVSSSESEPTMDAPAPVSEETETPESFEEPAVEPIAESGTEGVVVIAPEEPFPSTDSVTEVAPETVPETVTEDKPPEALVEENLEAETHSEDQISQVETSAEADPSSPEESITSANEGGEDWPPQEDSVA